VVVVNEVNLPEIILGGGGKGGQPSDIKPSQLSQPSQPSIFYSENIL
jgi:hypothetical protein